MDLLPIDLKNYVFEFLNIIDIIGLSHVNKYYNTPKNINIIKIFESRLLKVMMRICQVSLPDARILLISISKYNGIISGSTILQVLYGENYDNYDKTDLDIYFRNHEKDIDIRKCNRNDIISIINPNYVSKFYGNEPLDRYENDEKNNENNENVIRTIQCGKPMLSKVSDYRLLYNYKTNVEVPTKYSNIQLIEVATQKFLSDMQSITDSFDLSIVCNIYIPHKKVLEVFSLPKLVSRTSHIFKSILNQTRIEKYICRGIDIKDVPVYDIIHHLRREINNDVINYHLAKQYNWGLTLDDNKYNDDDYDDNDIRQRRTSY